MKRIVFVVLVIVSILIILSTSTFAYETINIKDYVKDKFPSIFSFYLSSLEELDLDEKEFIDLIEKLPKEEQEYYAKEVYKNGFSLELLENAKEGKSVDIPSQKVQVPTSKVVSPSLPKVKEKSIENLPSIIKRIKPSVVIVFTYNDKGEFLKLGSGFFINHNGDIITNYHVLQGANSAEIKASDGKTYPIRYIVADNEQSDLIRLSVDIPSQYVHPLSLNKTNPEVGERIIVYGSPLGWENTVSDGIISAIRDIPDIGKIIQITAPMSPGSSGSPVLNMQGEVIGIATFQMVEGQNLNFAIPSERIASLNLIEEEKTIITEELLEQEEKSKKDSDYAYNAADKASYFIDKKEYEKALPYLEIAIKTDISSLKEWAYFHIGFCYGELEDYTKAIEAYKQVIRIDPDYADAYYNLGIAYGNIDSNKYAIEAFKQAIRIDPDDAITHGALGLTYSLIGDKNSALNEYKILKELDIDLASELFDLIY